MSVLHRRSCWLCRTELVIMAPPGTSHVYAGQDAGHKFMPGNATPTNWECRTCVNAPPDKRTALLVAAALRP